MKANDDTDKLRSDMYEGASSAGEEEAYELSVTNVSKPCKDMGDNPLDTHCHTPEGSHIGIKETERTTHKSIGAFILYSGIPSFCFRYLLLCIILLGTGILGLYRFPTFKLGSIPITYFCLSLGSILLGFVTVLSILHAFVVFCHGRRLFYEWNFIHYMSELETYMALILNLIIVLIAISFDKVQVHSDKWIFGSANMRYLIVKITLGVILATILLAIKRHQMTGLAVSFNYSNYRDRIQESLFADRMLNLLQKSRHTYKFRQKLRTKDDSSLVYTFGKHRGLSSDHRDGIGDIYKSRPMIKANNSVRSAVELFSSGKGTVKQHALMTCSSPTPSIASPPGPTSQINILSSPLLKADAPSALLSSPVRSVPAYLTESDKKRQFNEFFRLANQMMSRFSNVADYRTEIANEAKRLSSKLYKYLRQYDRDYLMGQDLLSYIEDEEEFRRAVTLIKRYSENSLNTSTNLGIEDATNFAFSQADLQHAIDGILTELYVTAKSLQTIETALDKVDSFFTLLVALTMTIIIAIVVGDAVKLLLALSTMLSGAAFAFGTSARNMFESMIFLLVIHPFDVGDRVFIPLGTTSNSLATTLATMAGTEALDNLVVSEMHLLSTVFERWDGVKLYVPNYVLAAKPIFNIRRSGPLLEIQRIHIDFATPISKVDELRIRLDEFVRREQSDYTDISRVIIDSIENCNRINLNVIFQHSTNWQELDVQLARRSKVLSFIKDTLEHLGITYLPPLQRVAIVPSSMSCLGESSNLNLLTSAECQRLLQLSKTQKLPV